MNSYVYKNIEFIQYNSSQNKKMPKFQRKPEYFIPIYRHTEYQSVKGFLISVLNKNLSILNIVNKLIEYQATIQRNQTANSRNSSISPYATLMRLYSEEYIISLFSQLAKIVLQMENKVQNVLLLTSNIKYEQILSKEQACFIMASMALNLIPPQLLQSTSDKKKNFRHIFTYEEYKTKCIVQYFEKVATEQRYSLVLIRSVEERSIEQILNDCKVKRMRGLQLNSDDKSIEQFVGCGKVDFANKNIGGGALTRGCVQEEILFSNHPEMYISTILCQTLKSNESIQFIGFRKYNRNSGYSKQTKYDGPENLSAYKLSKDNIYNEFIVAIDAVQYKDDPMRQFRKDQIDRQIIKAYSGFNFKSFSQIATGNWGCGVFNGNLTLKFMIQWIACSLTDKQMIYCPYKKLFAFQKHEIFLKRMISKISIIEVYNNLISASQKCEKQSSDVIEIISNYYYQKNQKQLMESQIKGTGCGCCEIF